MEDSPKPELPHQLIAKYKEQASTSLKQYGKDFDQFTEGFEKLKTEGDKLILNEVVTGYNIILSKEDMDLASEERLIFYSNHIGKPEHFAELITEMIYNGIVSEGQIRLGKKASKTEYTGKWEVDPKNEKLDWIEGRTEYGEKRKKRVSKTVEAVIIFKPESDRQAKLVVESLYKNLEWEYPDIRATISLKDVLLQQNFEEVVANILTLDKAQIIALHTSERFKEPYTPGLIIANQQLVTFIATPRVPPE